MKNWKQALIVVAALLAANLLFLFVPMQVDTTSERRFTLTDETLGALRSLTQPVTVDFYMSRSVRGVPPALQSYCDYVEDLLEEYARRGDGLFRLNKHDPLAGSATEEQAMRSGMMFEELRPGDAASRFCLGVCFRKIGRSDVSLRQLTAGAHNCLEYDLTRALMRVSADGRVCIGVMSAMPVFGGIDAAQQKQFPPWKVISSLRECNYDVRELPGQLADVPEAIDILLLIQPEDMSESTLRAVDAFVQRGGRILAFLDPGCWTDMMYNGGTGQERRIRSSALERLTDAWGVGFDRAKIVLDKSLSTIVLNKQSVPESHIEWLTLNDANLTKGHPITAYLSKVECYQSGFFALKAVEGVQSEPLMVTSRQAQAVDAVKAFRHQRALLKDYLPDGRAHCLGVALNGAFPSAFEQGKSSLPTEIILFSDADLLHDNFTGERKNDNMQLLLNCADSLRVSDDGLLRLRNRSFANRSLTVLAEKEERNRELYQAELEKFQQERDQLASEAETLESGASGAMFSDVESEKLRGMYERIMTADRKLRSIQMTANREMEAYRQRIVLLNLLLGPGLLLVVLLGVPFVRTLKRDWKRGVRIGACIMTTLVALMAIHGALRLLGRTVEGDEEALHGTAKLLAKSLKREGLCRIEVTQEGEKTVLQRSDNGWVMPGKADFPVDMRMLNNFLESVSVCKGNAVALTDEERHLVHLDESGCKVTLLADGGQTATLCFGDWKRNYLGEPQGRYVLNDGSQTLLTGYRFLEVGSQGAWFQKRLPGFGMAAKRLKRESEFKDLSWGLDKRTGGYEVRGRVPTGYAVNEAVVKNIVENFCRMAILDIQLDVQGFQQQTRLEIVGEDNILYDYVLGTAKGRWYARLLKVQSVDKAEEARRCQKTYGKYFLEVSPKLATAFKRTRRDLFILKK